MGWRRWQGSRISHVLLAGGLLLCALPSSWCADELPLIAEDTPLLDSSLFWSKEVTAHAGFGYKDNVLLSPFQPVSSPFFKGEFEASMIRLPLDGLQLSFLLAGEDVRYTRNVYDNPEQSLVAFAQVKKDLGDRWQVGLTTAYFYLDQLQDVSITETTLARARVRGHSLTVRPSVRRTLGSNWWVQLEASGQRWLLDQPLDDYWQCGPRLALTRALGTATEISLSYSALDHLYDTQMTTDAAGTPIPGTHLERWGHKTELGWQNYWDTRRHWRTLTSLSFERDIDNGAGFYDFSLYTVAEQIRYSTKTWDIRVRAALGYYDFPVRTVTENPGVTLHQTQVSLGLRVERHLSKLVTIYGQVAQDWSLSNERFEQYHVFTAVGGVGVEF
jgi:hypothetical protein